MTENIVFKKLIYHDTKSNWMIFLADRGKCKGVVPWIPEVEEKLALSGEWKKSKYNGAQEFNFTHVELDIPVDPRALLHYACCLTKGIGEAKEQEIWDAYGLDWQDSEGLEKLNKLSTSIRERWNDSLIWIDEKKDTAKTVSWLMSHDCTLTLAQSALEKWQGKTMSLVKKNPYILAGLKHYGFRDIDGEIRKAFGISDTDQSRYDAGLIYIVSTESERTGNTAISKISTQEFFQNYGLDNFEVAIESGVLDKKLVEINESSLCLRSDYESEATIYKRYFNN